MKMNVRIVGLGFLSIIMVFVIAFELYHIATIHLQIVGDVKEFQQELLSGIRRVADMARSSENGDDLIERLNADNVRYLTRDRVRNLPRYRQGVYERYVNGASVPLDWALYDIDSIRGYRGTLAIGSLNGQFVDFFLTYSLYEEY